MDAGGGIAARFTWHPELIGRTVFDVRRELVDNISADQRAYAMAIDAAEAKEADALTAILALDKNWSQFDLGWSEADPGALADEILAWRWEQEKRQELIPYAAYKDVAAPPPPLPPAQKSWLDMLKQLFGR